MNPVCGDTLALLLRIDDGPNRRGALHDRGLHSVRRHGAAWITELGTGLTWNEAMRHLTHEDAPMPSGGSADLGKLHSAALVIDALRRAIAGYPP